MEDFTRGHDRSREVYNAVCVLVQRNGTHIMKSISAQNDADKPDTNREIKQCAADIPREQEHRTNTTGSRRPGEGTGDKGGRGRRRWKRWRQEPLQEWRQGQKRAKRETPKARSLSQLGSGQGLDGLVLQQLLDFEIAGVVTWKKDSHATDKI